MRHRSKALASVGGLSTRSHAGRLISDGKHCILCTFGHVKFHGMAKISSKHVSKEQQLSLVQIHRLVFCFEKRKGCSRGPESRSQRAWLQKNFAFAIRNMSSSPLFERVQGPFGIKKNEHPISPPLSTLARLPRSMTTKYWNSMTYMMSIPAKCCHRMLSLFKPTPRFGRVACDKTSRSEIEMRLGEI